MNVHIKIVFIAMFAILILPFYVMLNGSLQNIYGILAMPPRMYPVNPTLQNYQVLFSWPLGTFAFNTIIVVMATVVLSTLISCITGYAFAFFEFPFKRILWVVLLFGIMVPYISLVIPRFVVIRHIGLSGTLASVILPIAFSPTNIYLARCFFESAPRSLLESARIDGANELQILTQIVMPISKPIISVLDLLTAIVSMGDYLWQMLCLQDIEKQTLLIGLMKGVRQSAGVPGTTISPFGKSMAASVILFIPMLVIFLIGNRFFVDGIHMGAVKE